MPEVVRKCVEMESVCSCALAALGNLLAEDDTAPEAEFLASHRNAAANAGGFAAALDRLMHNPPDQDRLLATLAAELSLNRAEILTVALAAAVETDAMCGRAVAHLQAPVGGSRPGLGLLDSAFRSVAEPKGVLYALLGGSAIESELLQLLNESAPLAERVIAMPAQLSLALMGSTVPWPGASWLTYEDAGIAVPLPQSILTEAARHARALSEPSQHLLVLRGGSLLETKSVAAAIAASLNRRAVLVSATQPLPGFAPWLMLSGCIPVFAVDLGPGERRALPVLPHYPGPVLALCGPEGAVQYRDQPSPGWTIGTPCAEERRELWAMAVGDSDLSRDMAATHRHGSARIAHLGRLARHRSRLHGRDEPDRADIMAASWVTEGSGLETLAQPLREAIPEEAFVTTPALREELNRLLARCHARESLAEGLGASSVARYRTGVRALFTGPSGAGKTLAAGWIATKLGLPLYRVDLASVTSKYIGETEKNLAALLARAEEAAVVLLFDEADSLFGKRTDVKESNDRFANAQTNYLLQRIETFDGIALLTSNSRARFDSAFMRRLDVTVEFPVPGPEERRALWQSHLGSAHLVSQRELNCLSAAADLLGGHIRTAVFTAAVAAKAEGRAICYSDLLQALQGEYRKLGRYAPAELTAL
jgi:hypothetical protein